MTTTEAAAILRSDALCTVGPSRDARMMGAEALDRIDALERELAKAKRYGARYKDLREQLRLWNNEVRETAFSDPIVGRIWNEAADKVVAIRAAAIKGPNATE